ncbi:zinc ABC transporter substrate-binding protein [Patescibacteria group bacterium]|nr:zinc ABC transporter substrate-binding protein [Patescibacteria group bacterium]
MFKKIAGMLAVLILSMMIAKTVCAGDKLNVVVSILPQVYFVEKIGKNKVNVSVMIPPGGNPHTYEPTPSQLTNLSQADVYVKVGSGVEFELEWMDKLISFNNDMLVCDSSKGINLIAMTEHHHDDEAEEYHDVKDDHHVEEERHHHGGQDPHVWLSPDNAIVMVSNIRDSLIERDPSNEKFYSNNTASLILELSDLKKEIVQNLVGLSNRNFLVFHPSWGYFAADFNLKQIAVEHGGKDPTPKQLAQLIEEAKENDAKVIFVSPQFSQKSARTIAKEIDGRVESIDPLAKDYINNLRKLTNILAGKK